MKMLIPAIILMFSVSACHKESISPTQAQVTASKLKSDLAAYSIKNITVYIGNSGYVIDTSYVLTGDGFIQVGGYKFNLEQLKYYQVAPPNLTMYF
ncbi:MAG: hypothetical protein JSS79_14255 [Bacteroidetes bacterium]|nr:hypothetical protein [Bacteroidota bacterium]